MSGFVCGWMKRVTVRKKNRKKNKVTWGKTQSKCELEGDVKFMEMHFPGSTVWLNKSQEEDGVRTTGAEGTKGGARPKAKNTGVPPGGAFSSPHTRSSGRGSTVVKVMHSQGDDKPRLYPDLSGIEDGQEEYCEPTLLYPLVEVANPHYYPHQPLTPGNNQVIRVYRLWTESDLQEAC